MKNRLRIKPMELATWHQINFTLGYPTLTLIIAAIGTGTLTTTEGNVKSYTAGNGGETVDVAQKGVNNAQGGSGNDTLIGDANNNWLAGSLGADTINAGAGDDLILFDSQDTIDGGDGMDIAQVVGSEGVSLNLANAHDDILIGGAANDVEWRVAA